jgi:hypothetical protein
MAVNFHREDGKIVVVVCRRGVPFSPDQRPLQRTKLRELGGPEYRWPVRAWTILVEDLGELCEYVVATSYPKGPRPEGSIGWGIDEPFGAVFEIVPVGAYRYVVLQIGAPRKEILYEWDWSDRPASAWVRWLSRLRDLRRTSGHFMLSSGGRRRAP